MVGRKEDEGVVQHVQLLQLGRHRFHCCVDGLQGLQTFSLQKVGESLVNWKHLLRVTQDPLLVWVGGKVVGWSVVSGDVEEESAVLRSSIFRTMWTGVRQNCKEWFLNLVSGPFVKEFQTLVGDYVWQVILVVVVAVMSKNSVFV